MYSYKTSSGMRMHFVGKNLKKIVNGDFKWWKKHYSNGPSSMGKKLKSAEKLKILIPEFHLVFKQDMVQIRSSTRYTIIVIHNCNY